MRWLLMLLLLLPFAGQEAAEEIVADPLETDEGAELEWPRSMEAEGREVIVYQPQLESFHGNRITARAAVSVSREADEPAFGVLWMEAKIATDREAREVNFYDLEVTESEFPDVPEATDERRQQLADFLGSQFPTWDLTVSMDRFLTTLDLAEVDDLSLPDLPVVEQQIFLRRRLAHLVQIDGEPRLDPVGDEGLQRVVNTRHFLVKDEQKQVFYLRFKDSWWSAPGLGGPWRLTLSPPYPVRAAAGLGETSDAVEVSTAGIPELVVSTGPALILWTDGKPRFVPLADTGLQYVDNGPFDWLRLGEEGPHFALLSGRWYTAPGPDEMWSSVPGSELPENFLAIPPESDKAYILASIPGTDQAREAILDAHIPQTAVILRDSIELQPTFDGEPRFEAIPGTELEAAVNTPFAVIRHADRYYCCFSAVWFEADAAEGPWRICDDVPPEIYEIPPSSPLHEVTYVEAYDSSEEEIEVGYTPGYLGSYVQGDTLVHGAAYPSDFSSQLQYRPSSPGIGLSLRYNASSGEWGWGIHGSGFSVWSGDDDDWEDWDDDDDGNYNQQQSQQSQSSSEPQSDGEDPYPSSNSVYDQLRKRAESGQGLTDKEKENLQERAGQRAKDRVADMSPQQRAAAREKLGQRARTQNPVQAKRQEAIRSQIAARQQAGQIQRPRPSGQRANDVFAGPQGNVYRKTQQGWQQRQQGQWKAGIAKAKAQKPAGARRARPAPSQARLNNHHKARQRGAQRTQSFQKSKHGSTRIKAAKSRSKARPKASSKRPKKAKRSRPSKRNRK